MLQKISGVEIEAWLAGARPRLRRLAQLRGVDSEAVEDVVQETLLEAWMHLDRVHTVSGLQAWLDEICRNISRRYARRRSLELKHRFEPQATYHYEGGERVPEDVAASLLTGLSDPTASDPLEELSRQDMAHLLDRACGSLGKNAREVVHLCYLMELPQPEAAARLGLTMSALEARLHRARRQLRRILAGPLREEAEALGLNLGREGGSGWCESRLWCTLCGRRHLLGMFLPQPDGGLNLHMHCPDCHQRYGLSDVHNSNVHSKGLVQLAGLHSFRPAWKRTMQELAGRFLQSLGDGERRCPYCGTPASLQLLEKSPEPPLAEGLALPSSVSAHPYQFWVCWRCPHGHRNANMDVGVFAASDVVYWSHTRTRQFIGEHPRWISEPELLVEYAGQPALRFQMADLNSSARLTVLAHRQTLHVLAVYPH